MSQTHRKRRFVSLAVLAVCPCRLLRAQGLDPAFFATTLAAQPGASVSSADLPHPTLQQLTQQASALGAAGRYDEQLAVLDYAAGLTLASAQAHRDAACDAAAVQALFDLGLHLDGAGRSQDAVRVLSAALELAQHTPEFSRAEMFDLQLALAHAQAHAGDTLAANATCAAIDTRSVPASELRQHLLGGRGLLDARRQLFCGDEAAGRTALEHEISAHPHRGEPHRVLAQFDLANGRNADAAVELRLWRESADIAAATH